MLRSLTAIMLLASAGAAAAQSFQTALPVSPAERRAMEARLSTILEFGNANEMARFTLPSGRTMTVLPYRLVQRGGQLPCRGYRIDLNGENSRTAVDGFRCKRQDGRAWVIVEPEIVLAQEGPVRLRPPRDEETLQARGGGEPLYPADDVFAPDVLPPIPRPAPSRSADTPTQTAAVDTDSLSADADDPADAAPIPEEAPDEAAETADDAPSGDEEFASRVAALITTPDGDLVLADRDDDPSGSDDPAASADESAPAEEEPDAVSRIPALPQPDAQDAQDEDEEAARVREPEPEPEPRVIAAAGRPARDVTPGAAPVPASEAVTPVVPVANDSDAEEDDITGDENVIAALQDLDYLDASLDPTPDRVNEAIDAFAVDERFALPVSGDVLIERLDAALERSEGLPPCSPEAALTLCLEAASR